MNEFLVQMEALGTYLAGDVMNAVLVFFSVAVLALVSYAVQRFGGTEVGHQVKTIWSLVDDHIYNTAMGVAFDGRYNGVEANRLAAAYKTRFGGEIDPRLAWVINAAEQEIGNYSQIDFDFEHVANRVIAIYQERVKPLS